MVQTKSTTQQFNLTTCKRSKIKVSALGHVKHTHPCVHFTALYNVLPLAVYLSVSFDIFCENLEMRDPVLLTLVSPEWWETNQYFLRTGWIKVMVQVHLLWTQTRPYFSRSFFFICKMRSLDYSPSQAFYWFVGKEV